MEFMQRRMIQDEINKISQVSANVVKPPVKSNMEVSDFY